METSAKTGLNTQELFAQAGKLLYKEYSKFKKKGQSRWKTNKQN